MLGSFQEESFRFYCNLERGASVSVEDLVIAGQPKLPANVFGDCCPDFSPEGFRRDVMRIDIDPRGVPGGNRDLWENRDMQVQEGESPNFLGEVALQE
jgi:hypothetical protein